MPSQGFVPAESWRRPLARLARGTLLVVGAAGTGKSSLASWLVGQLQRALGRTALVSVDPGQSTIGAPTCLGLALTDPWEAPAASWFVGDTSLRGQLLPTVVGAAKLVARAREAGAQAVVVDAPGMVHDGAARALLHHLAAAVDADQVVALERRDELAEVRAVLASGSRRVLRFAASPLARDRSPEARRRYRETRFAAHFATASTLELPRSLVFDADWAPAAGEPAAGTVCGLLDAQGFCLALGAVEPGEPSAGGAGEPPPRETVRLRTPYGGPVAAVDRVQLGKLRLDAAGREEDRPPRG